MGRQSTVRTLPPQVLEALEDWLRDPAITQQEATRRTNLLLDEIAPGGKPVSQSAVQRYDAKFREVTRRMRESREIARRMIGELGSVPGRKLGHALTEMIRTAAFEVSGARARGEFDAESLPGVVKQLKDLALVAQRSEAAAKLSVQREGELKRQAAGELADRAEREAGARGAITPERLRQVALEVYGVRQ